MRNGNRSLVADRLTRALKSDILLALDHLKKLPTETLKRRTYGLVDCFGCGREPPLPD